MPKVKISPSILAADFTKLAAEVERVYNADYLHIDMMDGHFVPNLSFGPMVAQAVNQITDLPLDIHLMVTNPDPYIQILADLEPAYITVHYEACNHLQRTLNSIRELGIKAGVSLNPHTPIDGLKYVLDDLDLILVMTVNPGYGGQVFIPKMLDKIRDARSIVDNRNIDVEVDGGISIANIDQVVEAGANMIVAGSAIFGAPDAAKYITELRNKAS